MTRSRQLQTTLRRFLAVAGFVTVALAPVAASSAATDEFFESDLDGSWVGTVKVGKSQALLQLTLNAEADSAVGFVIAQDNGAEAPTGLEVSEATFTSVAANRVELRFDAASARGGASTTLKLTYDAIDDTLTGNASGALAGKATLVRADADLPIQRLWRGEITLAGKKRVVLLQLATVADPRTRFAADTIAGSAWVGTELGEVTGTLNGARLEATVDLDSGPLEINAALKKRNLQLKGQARQNGAKAKLKLLPSTANGKRLKFQSAARVAAVEVAAGEEIALALGGRNFADGATVHTDTDGALVTSTATDSDRRIRVTVQTSALLEPGAQVALRVLNPDGQIAERNAVITIAVEEPTLISFTAQVQPILTGSCALFGCHSAASAEEGLVLSAGDAFANLVNVSSSQQPFLNRVTPGNPDDSYLVRKIAGGPAINGGRMPLNRTPLTPAQLEIIRTWIQQGATLNRVGR